MSSTSSTIQITLRSLDGLDEITQRNIALVPGTNVSVGRSSKNANKQLMADKNNAYIDSPVISRLHATISATANADAPSVYIKDNGSMHGTLVNNVTLPRHTDYKLKSGDTVQFGVNVVRDQESFLAKKYRLTYEAAAPKTNTPFSRGFSVPSEVSSDEDIGDDTFDGRSSPVPQYGSESNPVNIDDFEDMATGTVDLEVQELDSAPQPAPSERPKENTAERNSTSPSPDNGDHPPNYEDDQSELKPLLPLDEGGDHDGSDHEEDDLPQAYNGYPDGYLLAHSDNDDLVSDEESLGDDESASESEAGSTDSEGVDDEDTKSDIDTAPPAIPAYCTLPVPDHPEFHSSSPATPFIAKHRFDEFHSERLKGSVMEAVNMFDNAYGSSWDNIAPSNGPSRASVSKPMQWGSELNGPILMREGPSGNPWYDDSTANMFAISGPEYRSDHVSPYSKPPGINAMNHSDPFVPSLQSPFSILAPPHSKFDESYSRPQRVNATAPVGVTTPPRPTSNDLNCSPPQSNSRTKVSIAEIVEEPEQQPPTPISVSTPNLKRKADDMESDGEEDLSEVRGATNAHEVAATTQTEVERPIKKPRGRLGYLASGAAGFVAGGIAVFGALWSLPDAAFQ